MFILLGAPICTPTKVGLAIIVTNITATYNRAVIIVTHFV
jgi:hypothetical protein